MVASENYSLDGFVKVLNRSLRKIFTSSVSGKGTIRDAVLSGRRSSTEVIGHDHKSDNLGKNNELFAI
jgi:hypothetical protein